MRAPRQTLRLLLHHRDGTRRQEPAAGRVDRVARRAAPPGLHRLPGRVVIVRLLPSPRVAAAVHFLARRNRHVAVHLIPRNRNRLVRFVLDANPSRTGVHHFFSRRVTLQQEAGPVGYLGHGSVPAVVPHHGRQSVLAGPQEARDVHRFVAPVEQIPSGRPPGNPLPVHEELVPVVGRHMNQERRRLGIQLERPAEMIHAVTERIRSVNSDPPRLPTAREQLRIRRLNTGNQE